MGSRGQGRPHHRQPVGRSKVTQEHAGKSLRDPTYLPEDPTQLLKGPRGADDYCPTHIPPPQWTVAGLNIHVKAEFLATQGCAIFPSSLLQPSSHPVLAPCDPAWPLVSFPTPPIDMIFFHLWTLRTFQKVQWGGMWPLDKKC